MNTNAELRKFATASPFTPFEVQMVDGRVYRVPHPEFIAIPPRETDRFQPYVYIFDPRDGTGWHINSTLVARIVKTKAKAQKRRRPTSR